MGKTKIDGRCTGLGGAPVWEVPWFASAPVCALSFAELALVFNKIFSLEPIFH